MLHSFFSFEQIQGLPQIHGSYHPGLVILSVIMPVFMAMMALQTAHIARFSPSRNLQQIAIITGSCALGAGVWITHFIGILALRLPAQVDYDGAYTLLSLVPAFLASFIALHILTRPSFKKTDIIFSGTLIGLGISLMHYIGMAAMITPLKMSYNPWLLALSVAAAILLSSMALWVRFSLNARLNSKRNFYLSSSLLGMAIGVMHYLGMTAASYYGTASAAGRSIEIGHGYIALALSSLSITAGGMVLALNSLMRTQSFNLSMKANQSRLQAILDTAVDAIITINGKGLVQDFNRGAEKLFGYDAFEVVGRNIKMLMPEPYQSEHDGYLENFHKTGKTKIIGIGREVTGMRKDGSTMPLRLAVGQVYTGQESEQLFVGLLSDISERHQLEASLREAAQKAEQAANAKSNFLANMSHEIRTPMNAILGFTELLLNGQLQEQQRNHLKTIHSSGKNLLNLINDILDTTKIEQGHLQLEQGNFSLRELAEQTHATLQLSAHNKGLYLQLDYHPQMPAFFTGDAMRISQVLTNLVGNAIKFTERGGVKVSYQYIDQQVQISVQDTGIGMTPEQQQSIFEPFSQADASISRRFGGTGLGTTIALQIVQSMQGSISIDSQPGTGSTFVVRLPLAIADRVDADYQPETGHSLPPLRFLIADDVPQNLQLLQLILEGEGHSVICAANGRAVIEKFATHQVDAILMDLHMPDIDGLQATRQIRLREQQLALVRTPIIALTASVMQRDREQAQAAGMDGFAIKPININQLFSEIAAVLQLQVTAPDDEAPVRQAQIINWQQGLALWGSRALLTGQISNFIDTALDQYPLNSDMQRQQLAFNLHGLRGACSNLALEQLSLDIAGLEELLRNNQQPAPEQLAAIKEQLHQVRLLLDGQGQTQDDQHNSQSADIDLTLAMQQLLQQLEQGHYDEQLVNRLYTALPQQQATALKNNIDNFDFPQASACLAQWLNSDD